MSLTQEIQQMIIDVLVLEDLTLDDIEPSAPYLVMAMAWGWIPLTHWSWVLP